MTQYMQFGDSPRQEMRRETKRQPQPRENFSGTSDSQNYNTLSDIPVEQTRAPPTRDMTGYGGHVRKTDIRRVFAHDDRKFQGIEFEPRGVDMCMQVARHMRACGMCGRMKSKSNKYVSIIVVLVFIIVYLITRLLDKKN